jgi:uncharacterized protein with von Willebrand factor type A (vWA) domain
MKVAHQAREHHVPRRVVRLGPQRVHDGEAPFDLGRRRRRSADLLAELDVREREAQRDKSLVLLVRSGGREERSCVLPVSFMLGDDPRLATFVDDVARPCSGRVVAPTLDGLGAEVVSDYIRTRKR